ncbi:hypothetical protein AB0C33_38770 [Nonomuraea sp. NPDC048881]|uniref:hypothetical protein n=1 Tax=Nonomuraea sp. NPDC048881 TaxID=3155030 RepID=UPI0033DC871F
MLEQLLARVVEEGCVPVALPTAAYRYFAEPPFGVAVLDMRRREVLPELVKLGAPWESIEVELSVPARRLLGPQVEVDEAGRQVGQGQAT